MILVHPLPKHNSFSFLGHSWNACVTCLIQTDAAELFLNMLDFWKFAFGLQKMTYTYMNM